jgi:hypothetical protein
MLDVSECQLAHGMRKPVLREPRRLSRRSQFAHSASRTDLVIHTPSLRRLPMHTAAMSKEQSESVNTRTGSTPAGVTLRPLCVPAPRSKDHAKPPRRSECLLDSVAHLCPFSRTPVFNGRRHIDGSSSFGPPLAALMALVRARHCRRREVQCRRGSGRTTDAWATLRTSRRHPPRRIPATWIPPARVRPAADNRRPVACRGRGSSRPRSTAS